MTRANPRIAGDQQHPLRQPRTLSTAIQPHGALLAVDPDSFEIRQASANSDRILGTDATTLLALSLAVLSGPESLGRFRDVLSADHPAANPVTVQVRGASFDAIVHRSDGLVIVEFEPTDAAATDRLATDASATATPATDASDASDADHPASAIYAAIQRLSRLATADELRAETVRELSRLTGFDRVTLHHFHPDGHGEVVAEEVTEGMESRLGLHDPASDQTDHGRSGNAHPTKPLWVIGNVDHASVALVPAQNPLTGRALDLSEAELRSAAPRDLELMRTSGLAVSLSLPLLHNGELIGLITCDHRSARQLPYIRRQGYEILARQVALQLGAMIETQRMSRQLAHLELHDTLTGLPNRLRLMERLDRALTGHPGGASVALLFIGLDRFKLVNDSLGHHVGDTLLARASERIVAAAQAETIVARVGGDEFVVLCTNTDAPAAALVAERILAAFTQPVDVDGHQLRITASVGISTARPGDRPADLLREAESAKHRAKERGRNRLAHYETGQRCEAERRLELERALRQGIERGELVLFYQPFHCIVDGSMQGVEALVRWERPGHGLVPPDDFIPLAEETGLIVPLGEWVLGEALRQLGRWKRSGAVPSSFSVSINLSPKQLLEPSLVDMIRRLTAEHALTPANVTLEITESALVSDRSAMTETITNLAEAGFSISIDDFGTGFSSLSYLRYLPAQQLKVDRSFVSGLTTDQHDAALVAAIIGLAHEFGMTCVAEGVETAEQLDRLRGLGCDFAQGYLLARPSAAPDLTTARQFAEPRR